MKQIKESKRAYYSPNIEKVLMDNDISLALASPFGDPELFGTLDYGSELLMDPTAMPVL
ncbi:MAG: hypothetical protein NTY32_11330 [Bacteroidia bacterium]|nr:hypothetical protein [Bacteroidia bacterium]